MIPSSRKVGKGAFEILMKQGRSFSSESFSARLLVGTTGLPARFSVVVAKKLEKSAVQRNIYKRRVYFLAQPFLDKVLVGTICVLFMKKKVNKTHLPRLTTEIKSFLIKTSLLKSK